MDNPTYEQFEPILQSLTLIASLAVAGMAGATTTYSRLYYNQHVWFKIMVVLLFIEAILIGRAALDPLAAHALPVLITLVCYLLVSDKSAKVSRKMIKKPAADTPP